MISKNWTTEAQRAQSFGIVNRAYGEVNNKKCFSLRSLCLCGEKFLKLLTVS